jgi:TetR/AcrR family transcriptional regulator
MPTPRRIGAADAKSRAQLLDAAEALLLEEGYAAVTSRRVGKKAGITPQLVHYYFRTMDDLFTEIFRRRAEEGLERFARALESDCSLHTIWKFTTSPPGATFTIEFAALANHRKAVRADVAHYVERFHAMQLDAITTVLAAHGVAPEVCPPMVVLHAMTGMIQIMSFEKSIGVSTGHDESVAFIERYIDEFERDARR